MKKVTYYLIVSSLFVLSVITTGGAVQDRLRLPARTEESAIGDVLLFTDRAGRIVVAVDEARDGLSPDGIMDKYYWYRSSEPYAKRDTVKISGAKLNYRKGNLELISQGVRLLFKFDPNESSRDALRAQDANALTGVFSRLSFPSQRAGATSDYSISGGYELGTAIPTEGTAFCDECIPMEEMEMESCDSGGPGSSGCSVTSGGSSCSVDCVSGYYACCNHAGLVSWPRCRCIKG
jgi:hypothetical protein